MKVLYLSDNNIFTIGGSQKSIHTMAISMVKKNVEVGIFMPKGEKNIDENYAIQFYTFVDTSAKTWLLKNIFKFTKKIKYIKKAIEGYEPDIVHAQNPTVGLLLMILIKFNKLKKSKFIYSDRDFFSAYSKFYSRMFRKNAKYFDAIVTTTDANNSEWKNSTNAKKVVTIPNVLEDYWFHYDATEEMSIKNHKGYDNSIVVGFSGRFVGYKRWDTVLKMCEEFNDNDKIKVVFAIISENTPTYNSFINSAKQILGNKLEIIEDANYEKMVEFYYSTDYFVLTSEKESFGRTIIEAMTKGNVVLGTNSGGVPSIIKKEEFLFEVGDINKPVEIINSMSTDQINKIKAENFIYAKQFFSIENMSNNMYNTYTSL